MINEAGRLINHSYWSLIIPSDYSAANLSLSPGFLSPPSLLSLSEQLRFPLWAVVQIRQLSKCSAFLSIPGTLFKAISLEETGRS